MNQSIGTTSDQHNPAQFIAGEPLPISYLQTLGATSGQVPTFNGSTVVWSTPSVSPGEIALTSGHILIGNGSNMAQDRAVTGDISLTNTGVATVVGLQGTAINASVGTPFTNQVLQWSGNPSIGWVNAAHQMGTASSGVVTVSGEGTNIIITTDSLTTTSGGTYSLEVISGQITSSSNVIATATLLGSTTGTPLITKFVLTGGSCTFTIKNIDPVSSFNGTLQVNMFAF